MKICIIGGGWMGCHIASALKQQHDVIMYTSTGDVFDATSLYNQNRLHLGYHYARSFKTRTLCRDTFNTFLERYEHVTDVVDKNLYVVPNESNIDFETYLKIFDDFNHTTCTCTGIKNSSGCIQVGERYINPIKSKHYFQSTLQGIINKRHVRVDDLQNISRDHDLVINATNNFLQPDTNNTFWEKCVMLIYKKVSPVEFDALTLVDGPFFSIYPYLDYTVTLSHVTYTPYQKSLSPITDSSITAADANAIKQNMEESVRKYYPSFNQKFEYLYPVTSVKIKKNTNCDDRSPVISTHNNIISCYTGKIQGMFQVENYIKGKLQ